MAKTPKKDGMYQDIPFETYLQWDAINASNLKQMKLSPKHVRHSLDSAHKETTDMRIGHAVHAALLQPEIYKTQYMEMPKFEGKGSRADKAEWKAEHAGTASLNQGELATVNLCVNAVKGDKDAWDMINQPGGYKELSIIWTDKKTGLRCKGRLDIFTRYKGVPSIIDLKSGREAPTNFWCSGEITTRGYHHSMSWYRDGLSVLSKNKIHRSAWFIFIEKSQPNDVMAYELDEDAMEKGSSDMREWLDVYADCVKSGEWPGLKNKEYGLVTLRPYGFNTGTKGYNND